MKVIIKKIILFLILILSLLTFYSFTFSNIDESPVKGWFLAGSDRPSYEIGIVKDTERKGKVAYLKSTKTVAKKGFGTIMQTFSAKKYLGKKVKLTGFIKTKDVKSWVGMWMRVDGKDKRALSFDNMQDRAIKGTKGWKKYSIILDVPKSSTTINYGVLLSGTGKVFIDDFAFEIVSESSLSTGKEYKVEPTNTSFED